ncbi:hypothetical protein CYLTODRAFT_445373 [Cylindrobasidium torrendii FP15055 ss-10]|uniref:Uncharacterized protein n=1 Tax=Cylindrobasidium torrendii FP15055 ss-10 TaxID=1314674 RepID=A0A0D7B4J7_9AGAR|nr:hypothetical protein CYLTODRAFT_445373 [Cylindrobasidium torrendii FP15055 ss-10]
MFSKLALFAAVVSAASIPDPTFTKTHLTDATSGAHVADVIPHFGAEFGLVTDAGRIYTDVRLAIKFIDEDASAFIELHGSGSFDNLHAYNYLRLETNSTTYKSLEDEFLYASIDVSQSPAPLLIYKLDV